MKLLLSRHADWRLKDLEEMTPLHLATRHFSPKPLSLLLKHMAPGEVDTQDRNKVPDMRLTSLWLPQTVRWEWGECEVRLCVCIYIYAIKQQGVSAPSDVSLEDMSSV